MATEEVVHVGAGYATDMVPAFELGLARIWINRRGEQADPSMPPTAELPDLSQLESAIETINRRLQRLTGPDARAGIAARMDCPYEGKAQPASQHVAVAPDSKAR